jgi:3-deoxy-manno-octulosonate cytidylyltransferase (CMP-KDO synthetase)
MSKTAVIIPARWASTRFPGKPLHLLAGKPLVQHVWERARRARSVEAVIIATDDMRIAEVAFDFGAEVALTSPSCVSGTDRCAEVARRLVKLGIYRVINVQGDEPLISPELITQLADALRENPKLQMVTAATPFAPHEDPANPNMVKVVLSQDDHALYFSRSLIPFPRDGAPFPFLRHLGIYGYSTPFLHKFVRWKTGVLEAAESLEQLRALEHGVAIKVLHTAHASIGVDTPADAEAAERLLSGASRLQSHAE